MTKLNWLIKSYDELNKDELFDIYYLRQEVFVVEQTCPYQDTDEKDKHSHHLMLYDKDVLTVYLRIVNPGISYAEPSIGRVVSKPTHRGLGLGTQIMEKAIQHVKILYPASSIRISAQQYLIAFYEALHFKVVGEGYLEDDIPHIEMLYSV